MNVYLIEIWLITLGIKITEFHGKLQQLIAQVVKLASYCRKKEKVTIKRVRFVYSDVRYLFCIRKKD